MPLETINQQELTVEPNPLIPGSYLVLHPALNALPDGTQQELWVLVLPTHRGRYCCWCHREMGSCIHAEAVSRYVERVRRSS